MESDVAVFGTQTAGPDKPDGRGIFEFGSTPGGKIEDHVAVINYSAQPLTLLIGASDAVNTPQGGFALLPANDRSKDVGTWIAFQRSDLTLNLPARSTEIIPFLVEVPKNATPGDHIGGITATLQSLVEGKSGQKVRLLQSVGSRVFIRVSGPLHPAMVVQNVSVKYKDPVTPLATNTAIITYTLRNTGNVALGGQPEAWVSGLFGTKSTAKKLPQIELLLPGFSVKETAQVAGVSPELRETAHISVTRLVIPNSVQPASGPFTARASFWAVPWILTAIVVIVLGGGMWWIRHRRRKGPDAGTGPRPDSKANVQEHGEAEAAEAAPSPNGTPSKGDPVEDEPATIGADEGVKALTTTVEESTK